MKVSTINSFTKLNPSLTLKLDSAKGKSGSLINYSLAKKEAAIQDRHSGTKKDPMWLHCTSSGTRWHSTIQ